MPAVNRKKGKDESEDDEEVDWEDALKSDTKAVSAAPKPTLGGNLQLTLDDRDQVISYNDGRKKGPSKLDRQKRLDAHRMHVQFLMFHNTIRNGWACDKKTQEILVSQLPSQIQEVVEKWRRDCGGALESQSQPPQVTHKGNGKNNASKKSKQSQRDWGGTAERLEKGAINLSRGDPTIRLLQYLAKYWYRRFHVTAPGLRKIGHRSVRELQREVASFRNEKHDPEEHGERIISIKEFRQCATRCEGSRDIGAQLFTALVRGLGVDARFVASLQPTGFGWNKNEEALPKKKQKQALENLERETSDTDGEGGVNSLGNAQPARRASKNDAKRSTRKARMEAQDGSKETPFDLYSDSELSDLGPNSDDSVEEITAPSKRKTTRKLDRDLKFPIYWTEVISPVTYKVYPVDSMILAAPATNEEQLVAFEPRGSKAEKAKQVMAYVIAHSADGTAKEVTTRYLKGHMWPGKTKGVRVPPEKVPIYNKRGKVKRYEEYDWFKTVMSGYRRRDHQRKQVDDIEDATDLKPATVEKKVPKEGEESLQWYRQSAEFCLERLLRREEALIPGSKPVKAFKSGKADNAKEEPVFRRADVVPVKTEESWHKEGRHPKPDAQPIKYAPYRAVTTARKREIEDLTRRNNGVKPMQGLYSKDQTEYIIPPPIENGVIPKNQYGNIDCFVPRMVPKGAVHVPCRGLVKVCKKMEIDYAEAVTGFEFGNRMAVPVVQGVVVAAEYEEALLAAWEEEEEKRQIREDEKRQALILGTWRKYLMGLRILEKMRTEYGVDDAAQSRDSVNPFTNPNKVAAPQNLNNQDDDAAYEDTQGGFVREDESENEAQEDDFVGELEIIDDRKKQRNASFAEGFMTATSEEFSDKIFDNQHENTMSSELSSHGDELIKEATSESEAALPKASRKRKKTPQALPKELSRRRSARTRRQKSKYFEASSDNDIAEDEEVPSHGDAEDEARQYIELDTSQETKSARSRVSKAKEPCTLKQSEKPSPKKTRGRGRPRKTI